MQRFLLLAVALVFGSTLWVVSATACSDRTVASVLDPSTRLTNTQTSDGGPVLSNFSADFPGERSSLYTFPESGTFVFRLTAPVSRTYWVAWQDAAALGTVYTARVRVTSASDTFFTWLFGKPTLISPDSKYLAAGETWEVRVSTSSPGTFGLGFYSTAP